jgi:hypothetical protein
MQIPTLSHAHPTWACFLGGVTQPSRGKSSLRSRGLGPSELARTASKEGPSDLGGQAVVFLALRPVLTGFGMYDIGLG